MVRFRETATGATESTTVTVAVQVALLRLLSVTVRVTVFGPTWLQSKLVLSRLRLAIPQASELPLLTCSGVMVAWQVASNWIVRSWQTASGGTESTTARVAAQAWLLPFGPITARVAQLAPTLEQSSVV